MAARQIGVFFNRANLPLISGFLAAGLIAGPHVLNMIPSEAIAPLKFIDQIALAFIAFAAGGELQLRFLRGRLKSLLTILLTISLVVLVLGVLAFLNLAQFIPFLGEMSSFEQVLAASLLGGAIMVARSPSSALAIIKELRAKGPFTSSILGVTVITDAVVIMLFAIMVSFSNALLEGGRLNLPLVGFVGFEILLDIGLGLALALILRQIMALRSRLLKSGLLLLAGYMIFLLSDLLHGMHLFNLPLSVFSEPLLIGMTAGFVVANFTKYSTEFHNIIEELSPLVFILFFTLVGASLEVDVLIASWVIAVVLVMVRLAAMFLGGLLGGVLARDPLKFNLISGLAYITQAGVSVGLAKEIAVEFPIWGESLATFLIGVIVINQVIGPPFLKLAINLAKESHVQTDSPEFDGVRDTLIFGFDNQTLALARQLELHGWHAKVVCDDPASVSSMDAQGVRVECTDLPLTRESLQNLEIENADAIVLTLDDNENYNIAELNFEHFGVRDVIVLLREQQNFEKFHELGALIVDPNTAIVSLLDHLVRSPVAASLILGMEEDQDVVEIEVRDPSLHGVAIRDLHLPTDVLIMSIIRDGHPIISVGYTQLRLGDEVTCVGSLESLDEVTYLFDA